MSFYDILKLLVAVTLSFGGGAAIVIWLSGYLGGLWAKRILQNEQSTLQRGLNEHLHELSLAHSSYEHYLDLILAYYKTFYRHYRLCQRTSEADAHRQPDGAITYTKEEFLSSLDSFLEEWASREGEIRLLLPSKVLAIHMEAIDGFNKFKQAIDAFDTTDGSREKKEAAFREVDEVKNRLESQLREFLRTEKLLK